MNHDNPENNRSQKSLGQSLPARDLRLLHVPLGLLGAYNLYKLVQHHVIVWRSLHEQGIGHLYLAITTVSGSWWLGLACMLCFGGNYFLSNDALVPRDRSLTRVILFVALGCGLSLIVPSLMQSGFFIVITWVRSLL